MRRTEFYPYNGSRLTLPMRHIKAYMLGSCFEYTRTTREEKINHLAYAVANGYDIWQEIKETEIDTGMLNWTLASYIGYMRYPLEKKDCTDMTSKLAMQLSIKELYDLFLEELRYYVIINEVGEEILFSYRDLEWPRFHNIRKVGSIWYPSKYEHY